MANETKSSSNPLSTLDAAIRKLGGLEEAMRQLDELTRKIRAMTPEQRLGIRQVETPVLGTTWPKR